MEQQPRQVGRRAHQKGAEDRVLEAAAVFFEGTLAERDRAFLVEFASRPHLAQALTGDLGLLRERLSSVEVGGDTAFYDAILFSIAQFQGVGGRKALVVLTDGEDYGSHFSPERCIEQALAHGVQLYVIEMSVGGEGSHSL